jgi:hypothetical protein
MSDLILEEHFDELIHLLKSVHAVSDLLASLRHTNLEEETQEYIGFLIGRLCSESLTLPAFKAGSLPMHHT